MFHMDEQCTNQTSCEQRGQQEAPVRSRLLWAGGDMGSPRAELRRDCAVVGRGWRSQTVHFFTAVITWGMGGDRGADGSGLTAMAELIPECICVLGERLQREEYCQKQHIFCKLLPRCPPKDSCWSSSPSCASERAIVGRKEPSLLTREDSCHSRIKRQDHATWSVGCGGEQSGHETTSADPVLAP